MITKNIDKAEVLRENIILIPKSERENVWVIFKHRIRHSIELLLKEKHDFSY